MPTFTPRVRLDLDEDGGFTDLAYVDTPPLKLPRGLALAPTTTVDPNEDLTADVRRTTPIVIRRGRDFARELAPFRAGTIDYLVHNEDGKYSSRNPASPLFGLMRSGLITQVDVTYGAGTRALGTAYTNEPEEHPLVNEQSVRIYALDGLGKAGMAKIWTDMLLNKRIDELIHVVLDAINWPASKRIISVFATTLPRWWAAGITAFQALKGLVLTEGVGAMLYVDGDGNVVGEDRHYRLLTPRSITSQATFRDQGAEPLWSRFTVIPGEDGIINSAAIPVRMYSLAALAPIWTGPTPLVLAPDETWTTTVSTTGEAFDNAVDPTAGAGDFAATNPVVSATLDRDGGKTATLTIVAPAAGTTLTGLRVRAQVVSYTTDLVHNSIDASASIAQHGLQTLPDDFTPDFVPTMNEARDYANAVVGRNLTERAQLTIMVNNATDERLTEALERNISDRLTAIDTSARASFDGDAIVEAVEYRLDSHGDVLEATLFCEEARSSTYWVLGVAGYSELGDTTVPGY